MLPYNYAANMVSEGVHLPGENRYLSLVQEPTELGLHRLSTYGDQKQGRKVEKKHETFEEKIKREKEEAEAAAKKKAEEEAAAAAELERQLEEKRKELQEKKRMIEEEKKRREAEEAKEKERLEEEAKEAARLEEIAKEKKDKQDRIDKEHEDLENLDFWGWVEVFAYIINLWVFAVPWTILGFLCILINIFLNIDYNKGWAEGNVFLMGNTIYAII